MSGSNPRVEAIGVTHGLISTTGRLAKVEKQAGKKTQYLNLKGRTVLPGFIDTHVHLSQSARLLEMWILPQPAPSVRYYKS